MHRKALARSSRRSNDKCIKVEEILFHYWSFPIRCELVPGASWLSSLVRADFSTQLCIRLPFSSPFVLVYLLFIFKLCVGRRDSHISVRFGRWLARRCVEAFDKLIFRNTCCSCCAASCLFVVCRLMKYLVVGYQRSLPLHLWYGLALILNDEWSMLFI